MTDISGIATDSLLLSAMAGLSEQRPRTGWVDPTKQAVVVLPFTNMSGDAEQEYFADGLTEDIITELSRFKNLFMISRNTSFHFKGRNAQVLDVGLETGAQYVVEGSVRKAGNRIRVTSQLVETTNGAHLWAEKFDRALDDVFVVQDELVRAITGIIPGEVNRLAVEQLRRKPPENLNAYDCELRGRWAYSHWNEGLAAAIGWYEKAVQSDPNYAVAHAGLGRCYAYSVYVMGMPAETQFALARHHVARATALDDRNPTVQQHAALVYHLIGERELANIHSDRAVALNPNDSQVLDTKGQVLSYSGQLRESLEWYARSEKIDPYAPDDQRLDCLADTYYMLGEYEKVVRIHRATQNVPAFLNLVLAASLAQLERLEEARAAVRTYHEKRAAGHDAKTMIENQIRMCGRPEDRDHWREGYRKAGLRE